MDKPAAVLRNTTGLPHVIIIGGGFAGLECARRLKRAKCRVTLFDSKNHHLFQPLLYQVATAGLAAPDIAAPIRKLVGRQKNTTVLLRRVNRIDLDHKRVEYDGGELSWDFLVMAAGAVNHYYGHPEWEAWAPGLKTIDDAFEIRRRVLGAFEEAELESDPERRRELLTFGVVGGGATGVELAGALAEIARRTMTKQFRHFDPADARVILVEGGPRLLNGFPEELCEKAKVRLEKLGVEVRLETRVEHLDFRGIHTKGGLIPAKTVLWAAGIAAEPLAKTLAPFGVELDRMGRVKVGADLHPRVAEGATPTAALADLWVCGDIAALEQDGKPVPGVAPGAIQMGRHAAKAIEKRIANETVEPFRYFDKGQLATIGKMSAVAALGKLRFAGRLAWLLWVVVHIMFLASFRSRIVVMFEWAWAWFSWSRPSRIILEKGSRWPPPDPPSPAAPQG
ncbi:MAG TPA: NAD(P)/FAD-dependent oxidoreductase [Myxococcota bacterium]|nr:NAD(P)/FAD-dependent oxidoreductase [Myxococcota bacterium]